MINDNLSDYLLKSKYSKGFDPRTPPPPLGAPLRYTIVFHS